MIGRQMEQMVDQTEDDRQLIDREIDKIYDRLDRG